MLLCMPAFSVNNSHADLTSASYGANTVFDSFMQMRSGVANRSIYEESMLQYVYYHNWFKGKPCGVDESCPATTFSHAFWAGFSGRDKSYAELQRFANEARLQKEVVSAWDHNLLTEDYVYVAGRVPAEAREVLTESWTTECQYGGWNHVGTSLLSINQDQITYAVR
ncbi:Hypothetical protein SCF082_LOCUS12660 [Durusdinium trenchii]|uniref:Uncharacterized protein n=1 Tax=Durusdinium trenchii TaxID=1381693 RepID=A0ABP0JMA2_9DINO